MKFAYHSEQIHSEGGKTRRNIVSIKNGKGYKSVEIFGANGKVKTRKRRALKKSELDCIHRNKFIPGLFKDCISRQNKLKNKF
jgi:hypothetical protein